MPETMRYLQGYPVELLEQVEMLFERGLVGAVLEQKYPRPPEVTTDHALYGLVMGLKAEFMKRSPPLSRIAFDDRLEALHRALGLHSYVSRVQGPRLKAKNELRVSSVFKTTPPEFLRAVVVHELAHLREKDHNKAFYQLCRHMEPAYEQLEFDLRLYLTWKERG